MARIHEVFAKALRASRDAAGLSQAELAARAGMSIEAYGRLERGRVLPRTPTLVRISRALHVRIDDLLAEKSDAAPQNARARAALLQLRAAAPEDLRFLVAVLAELQRWKRDVQHPPAAE